MWIWTYVFGRDEIPGNPGNPTATPPVPATPTIPAIPGHAWAQWIFWILVAAAGLTGLYYGTTWLGLWGFWRQKPPEAVKTTTTTVMYEEGYNAKHMVKDGQDSATAKGLARAEMLKKMAQSGKKSDKEAVIEDALKMRVPETFPVMASLLTDKDVGKKAGEALVKLGKAEDDQEVANGAIEALAETLERGPNSLRKEASACLTKVGAKSVVRVIAVLGTEDEDVLWYTQQAIFNSSGAKEELEKALTDCKEQSISIRAGQILEWIKAGKIPGDIKTPEQREAEAKEKARLDAEAERARRAQAAEEARQRAAAQVAQAEADLMRTCVELEKLNVTIPQLAEVIRSYGWQGAPPRETTLFREMSHRRNVLQAQRQEAIAKGLLPPEKAHQIESQAKEQATLALRN